MARRFLTPLRIDQKEDLSTFLNSFVFENLSDAVIALNDSYSVVSPAAIADRVGTDLNRNGGSFVWRKVFLRGGSRYSVEDSVNGDVYDELVTIERLKKSGKRTFANSKTSSSYSQLKPGFVGKHGLCIKYKC